MPSLAKHINKLPSQALADSLEQLRLLQDRGIVAIRAAELTRTHRERLQKNGFLQSVIKGWYIASNPDTKPGESTAWYASFWTFCANYLDSRFGREWCLAPETSLAVATGEWSVPTQVQVRSPKGGNKPLALPFQTSIFDMRLDMPPNTDMQETSGLRHFSIPSALIAAAPNLFTAQPIMMRAALATIKDASDLLGRLLAGGNTVVAGRLAGALRNIGRHEIADGVVSAMRAAGFKVTETDPFDEVPTVALDARETSPYVNRVAMLWQIMRADVLAHFPAPPLAAMSREAYLRQVDDIYATDAYNSLSIEGYKVTLELIERVRSGNWDPENYAVDRQQRDALAARGYWQAFQRVKTSVQRVLDGDTSGTVARQDHGEWYRELFGPSVQAGILRPQDLAGYRSGPIYIRHSSHVPPNRDAVRELMPAFFGLLENEPEPAVRLVLGHFIFVYIHPYTDGNGRTGRFMMNVMAASGTYPWIVVPVERRSDYMRALESASSKRNIVPFTQFLASLLATEPTLR